MNPTRIVSLVIAVIALAGVLVIAFAGEGTVEALVDSAAVAPADGDVVQADPPTAEIAEADVSRNDSDYDSWIESASADSQDSDSDEGGEGPASSEETGSLPEDSGGSDDE